MCFEYNRVRCLDVDWELDRKNITLRDQLGIGEFGPIYDAELQLGLNVTSRAVVKVVKFKFVSLHFLHHSCTHNQFKFVSLHFLYHSCTHNHIHVYM